jgi:hypothetical protein
MFGSAMSLHSSRPNNKGIAMPQQKPGNCIKELLLAAMLHRAYTKPGVSGLVKTKYHAFARKILDVMAFIIVRRRFRTPGFSLGMLSWKQD